MELVGEIWSLWRKMVGDLKMGGFLERKKLLWSEFGEIWSEKSVSGVDLLEFGAEKLCVERIW